MTSSSNFRPATQTQTMPSPACRPKTQSATRFMFKYTDLASLGDVRGEPAANHLRVIGRRRLRPSFWAARLPGLPGLQADKPTSRQAHLSASATALILNCLPGRRACQRTSSFCYFLFGSAKPRTYVHLWMRTSILCHSATDTNLARYSSRPSRA